MKLRQTCVFTCAALVALAGNARAMQINIVAGAALSANAPALSAFQRAADAWDVLFSDPIVVTIQANLGTFGNPNIIGSTWKPSSRSFKL